MRSFFYRHNFYPVFAAIVLLVIGMLFAGYLTVAEEVMPDPELSFSARFLGEARFILSDSMYKRADVYFHKGVPYFQERAFSDIFVQLREIVSPSSHEHLEGREVEEILPWLYFAMKTNPVNSEPFLVAAYWLVQGSERPDVALQVLQDAQRHMPNDYKINVGMAKIHLKTGEKEKALNALDSALKNFSEEQDDYIQARIDLAEVFTYRGLLFEEKGDIEEAIVNYSNVIKLIPSRRGIAKRLANLQAGESLETAPHEVWDHLISHFRHVCDHVDHDHGQHDHHD